MHACGHDGHVSILLGAARILKEMSDEGELPNPVLVLLPTCRRRWWWRTQNGGRRRSRWHRDWPPGRPRFGLHGWPKMPLGQAGSIPGPMLAAADRFELLVEGTGGHAAAPQYARDPVLCGPHCHCPANAGQPRVRSFGCGRAYGGRHSRRRCLQRHSPHGHHGRNRPNPPAGKSIPHARSHRVDGWRGRRRVWLRDDPPLVPGISRHQQRARFGGLGARQNR